MAEPTERMLKLQQMLEREPNDTFVLYALALEHKKANDAANAIAYLERVIAADPGYCYAYHQRGLIHEGTGDLEAARRSYREGIEAARKTGDAHAQSEIEAALDMIS